jgi:hypothetical protein
MILREIRIPPPAVVNTIAVSCRQMCTDRSSAPSVREKCFPIFSKASRTTYARNQSRGSGRVAAELSRQVLRTGYRLRRLAQAKGRHERPRGRPSIVHLKGPPVVDS